MLWRICIHVVVSWTCGEIWIIVVSIIDRTYAEEKGEYAENCDKFFAFGCKYNNGIIVISDRVDRRSPSDTYGTRNPYRDLHDKIDFSHLPYHRLKQIYNETSVDNQLLLPAPSSENIQEFCSEFDLEGYIYITAIISIIINKYFKNDNWNDEVKVFGSELKFITAAESKALVKLEDNMVTLPDNSTTAKDYPDKDKVFNPLVHSNKPKTTPWARFSSPNNKLIALTIGDNIFKSYKICVKR